MVSKCCGGHGKNPELPEPCGADIHESHLKFHLSTDTKKKKVFEILKLFLPDTFCTTSKDIKWQKAAAASTPYLNSSELISRMHKSKS